MKIKKKTIEEIFRKYIIFIEWKLKYIQNEASICYHGNGQKKYYVLNGSTCIALLSYFIKVYITYAMCLVYLVQKLYYST